MTFECSPTADLATCESFGLYKTPLPISTNNHLVLDLLSFTSTSEKNPPVNRTFEATAHAAGDENAPKCLPVMEGMRSTLTSLVSLCAKEKRLEQKDLLHQFHHSSVKL